MKSVDFYALSNFNYVVRAHNKLNDTLGTSPSIDSLSEAIEKWCELNITELSLQVKNYYAKYDAVECIHSKIVINMCKKFPNLGVQSTVTYGSAEDANGVEGTWLLG